MKNTQAINEIKRLKALLKLCTTCEELFGNLLVLYEKISNRKDKDYNAQYNVLKICNAKTIQEFGKNMKEETTAYFEIKEYGTAPNNFVIIYNEFFANVPTKWEMFVTKINE